MFDILVALLATVVMWLYDMNIGGVLNLTSKARENLAKALKYTENTQIGDSDVGGSDGNDTDGIANRETLTKSKYIKRSGAETGNSSDCEPLLQQ